MRISRPAPDRLVLSLGKREAHLLLTTLRAYPVQTSRRPTLTKNGRLPDQEASEHLLAEALTEQRREHRARLEAFLADPQRLENTDKGYSLSLSLADAEWLLQVLNEIRVGTWIKLGAPEDRLPRLSVANARDVWTMEVSGYFETHLLEGLTGTA